MNIRGTISRYPNFKSAHCNSFEVQAPVHEIYGCSTFKWFAETELHNSTPAMGSVRHAILNFLAVTIENILDELKPRTMQ